MASRTWNNYEIVTIALCLAGGDSRAIHTEEIADVAYKLTPARFSWTTPKYSGRIDKDIVRVSLTDAEKTSKGGYVISHRDKNGQQYWRLTPSGGAFCAKFEYKIIKDLDAPEITSRRPKHVKIIKQIRDSRLWHAYQNGKLAQAEPHFLTELLRIPPDSSNNAISREFDALLTQLVTLRDDTLIEFMERARERFCSSFESS